MIDKPKKRVRPSWTYRAAWRNIMRTYRQEEKKRKKWKSGQSGKHSPI